MLLSSGMEARPTAQKSMRDAIAFLCFCLALKKVLTDSFPPLDHFFDLNANIQKEIEPLTLPGLQLVNQSQVKGRMMPMTFYT